MSHVRRPMRVLAAAVGLPILVACAGAGGTGGGDGAAHGVDVRTVLITIHFSHFRPDHLTIARGTTVRFIVPNTDPIDHEFIVGNSAVQLWAEHSKELAHDGSVPGQISVPAGTTRTTTYTFDQVEPTMEFACHLPGHYAYGMHGPITITG